MTTNYFNFKYTYTLFNKEQHLGDPLVCNGLALF